MGSDLRTSARDLLTLAQKVSKDTDSPEETSANGTEQLQHGMNPSTLRKVKNRDPLVSRTELSACPYVYLVNVLQRKVLQEIDLLQGALEHVEDIDDEDETRILREPMDALQIHIKEALQLASGADKAALAHCTREQEDLGSSRSSVEVQRSSAVPIGFPSKPTLGAMTPGTPPLSGSVHRHPLGLFSTSPKFTAHTPFSASGRAPASRLSAAMSLEEPSSESPLAAPIPIRTSKPAFRMEQAKTSTLTAVNDGPLSIATTPPQVKPSAKANRADTGLDSATTPSSLSSAASFSTAITSPLDVPPPSPPRKKPSAPETAKLNDLKKDVVKTQPVSNPSQRRRVPRGLFSSVSTSASEPSRLMVSSESVFNPSVAASFVPQKPEDITRNPASTPNVRKGASETFVKTEEFQPNEYSARSSLQLSRTHISEGSSAQSVVSQPQSPRVQDSEISENSLYSPSNSTTGLKSPDPASPGLQRSQPKPSPIQTTLDHGTDRRHPGQARKQDDQDEELSQLAKDLERAMNPTPTDPVPQPYFLQGKGLLQRIPSQVSMDDGLLDEDRNDHLSEDSDGGETHGWQGEETVPGLARNNSGSSLRRQRSGRRRFRISRSRSRNRSRGRQENSRNSKPALTPIEIGYPSALTSSEWPFDKSPPPEQSLSALQHQRQRQRPQASSSSRSQFTSSPVTSMSASQLLSHQMQRQQHPAALTSSSRSAPSLLSQQQQPLLSAVPHLPFAESVTIGNPVRVGRGINSFTVYSITLTLCDPAKAKVTPPPTRNRSREVASRSGRLGGDELDLHAGHAADSSSARGGQVQEEADGAASHDRGYRDRPLPPTINKPSLLMTRSMSFPDLGSSAERMLMEIGPMPGSGSSSGLSSLSAVQHANEANSFSSSATTTTTSTSQPPAPPQREIHVRKRYSDFVALRAQLVAAFKDPRRGTPTRGRQMFATTTAASPSSIAPRVSPYNSQPIHPSRDSDDDDDYDADGYMNGGMEAQHSRTSSSASLMNVAVCGSGMIRGMPKLPPKKVVGKFRPAFVEKRRRELEYFLEWVVAHPVIGDCPVVVQWFLGQT
ncbi:hypothetical protein BGZ72_009279 [Mortierella alpina]|nr:hypothetical protein BGZ72_009279 [Mortierella alpina]